MLLPMTVAGWAWTVGLAQATPVTYGAISTVSHGEQAPEVWVDVHEAGRVAVDVTCAGRTWSLSEAVPAGERRAVALDGVPAGETACTVVLDYVGEEGGGGEASFPLTVRSLPLIALSSDVDWLDEAVGTLAVRASRAVSLARMTARGARGVVVAEAEADLADPTRPTFAWTAVDAPIVEIVVQAQDEHGFEASLRLLPWQYAIPHEDVVFATGDHGIVAEEAPKLTAVWDDIERTLALYGEVVDIRLYVGGYTDTVGDPATNRALSLRRARSIAAWFAAKGFSGPIAYQGFGEDVLAVPTADGVDHPANRRAVYVLSAREPSGSDFPSTGTWRTLAVP